MFFSVLAFHGGNIWCKTPLAKAATKAVRRPFPPLANTVSGICKRSPRFGFAKAGIARASVVSTGDHSRLGVRIDDALVLAELSGVKSSMPRLVTPANPEPLMVITQMRMMPVFMFNGVYASMKRLLVLPFLLMSSALAAPAVQAQSPEGISIQLNTAETAGDACRLTFVIRNQLSTPVSALGLDLVMFDQSEGVSGYAAVDFGAMPAGKTVVRQYDVGKGACASISRVLLNEVRACDIASAPETDCLSKLQITSRSEIEFIL